MSVFICSTPTAGGRAKKPAREYAIGESLFVTHKDGIVTDEFIVINQGIPSNNTTLYDNSANGTWIFSKYPIGSSGGGDASTYSGTIVEILRGYFADLEEAFHQNAKKVKLKAQYDITIEENVFLLSSYELGYTSSTSVLTRNGAKVSWFNNEEQWFYQWYGLSQGGRKMVRDYWKSSNYSYSGQATVYGYPPSPRYLTSVNDPTGLIYPAMVLDFDAVV